MFGFALSSVPISRHIETFRNLANVYFRVRTCIVMWSLSDYLDFVAIPSLAMKDFYDKK